MKKKILAIFLSLCMAMSLLPVTALATGDEETETQTPTESSITTEKDLKEAINAARPGDTVKLGENITITDTVFINKQITLDLNEKKIDAKTNIWNQGEGHWSLISVGENGNLTVTGNGTLQAKENDTYAIDVNGGSCTIQDGTFVGNIHAVYVSRGTLVVNGGTFSVQQKYQQDETKAYEFVLNCYDENYQNGSSSITVNGGTFANFNPANCKAEGEGTSFMSSDCESKDTKDGETTYWTVTKKATISVEKQENETGTVVDATVGGVTIPNGAGSGDITTEGQTLTLDATVKDDSDAVTTSNVTVGGTALNAIADKENVANVAIETNVGTLTVSKAALEKIVESAKKAANNGITPDVTLSIEKVNTTDADNGVTYNVNATVAVGGTTKEVFTEASADSNATIQVSVPAPKDVTGTVHVYYLGPNGAEKVTGAEVEEGNVSWTVNHFSTYYVTATEQSLSVTVEEDGTSTTKTYDSFADAMTAIASENGKITIQLMSNITVSNEGLTGNANTGAINISKSLTIDGKGHTISAADSWRPTSTDGNANHIINVLQPENGEAITVDIKNLTIDGKKMKTKHGINVFTKDSQTTTATVNLENVTIQNCGTAGLVINNSTVTATNLTTSGNAWGAVNVDNSGKFELESGDLKEANQIWSEDAAEETGGSDITVPATWTKVTVNKAGDGNKADIKTHYTTDKTLLGEAYNENKNTVYDTVERALNAAEENETVQVIKDADIPDSTNVTVPEKVTLVVNPGVELKGDLTNKGTIDNKGTITGNVTGSGNLATEVTFQVTPSNATVTVRDNKGDVVTGTNNVYQLPNGNYTYTVSANGYFSESGTITVSGKVQTISVTLSKVPPANPNYRIDIPAAEGGTITANPTAAKAGATVTLTATPDEGYAVGTITVTDRFGDAVKVTENADGTYTFTMPNGQVTVKATFVETEEPAPAEPFPDVDENDWFYDEVVYVYENGLMNGVENNQFAPNTATNRAMLATILYRLAGQPDVSGDLPFTDVAAGTWYTDAVLWAAQNGIVNGLGENTFAPMNTLTREQLVTMLYRYAEAEGYDVSAAADLSGYPDAGKVQSWAQEAMTWAVAEGIVEGMDGNLNPAGNATRAQIATILMRFCEGVAK